MKAVRIHGPKDARFEEVPTPHPGPDDVLVRVRAAAICATDVELFEGTMYYLRMGMTHYPFIPGHEWSGEVVQLGERVRRFSVGDRVVGECSIGCRHCRFCLSGRYHLCADRSETGLLKQPGAMAEFISFPQYFLHKVGDLSLENAAFVEPTGVAISAVRKARVTPADRVAVIGAGPIGLFAIQVAKAYGAKQIIAVDLIESRLKAATHLGADVAVNIGDGDPVAQISDATQGEMVDAVIEAVGKKEVWPLIASIVAPSGRVAITGLFAGETCAVDFDPLVTNDISVMGSLGGPNVWPEAISLHQRGLVSAERMITHRLPLSAFSQAMEIARGRQNGAIKVLFEL